MASLVEEWLSQHADEIASAWNHAQRHELPGRIEPLAQQVAMSRIVKMVTDPADYVIVQTMETPPLR